MEGLHAGFGLAGHFLAEFAHALIARIAAGE